MMFYFRFEVLRAPDSKRFVEVGGAFASCWIEANDEASARRRAITTIESKGWKIKSEEESFTVGLGDYLPRDDGFKYYEEAKKRGEAYSLQAWPIEDNSDETIQ